MSTQALEMTYDEGADVYRTTCPKGWDVSTCVVMAIEEIEGRSGVELPPLNSYLNVGALNSLFDHRHDETPRRGGRIVFYYCGYEITVHHHGTVTLSECDEP